MRTVFLRRANRGVRTTSVWSLFVRAVLLAVTVALLAPLLSTTPAAASTEKFNPPKQFYLALGDSLAFGFQDTKFISGLPNPDPATFNTGYVDVFARRLATLRPGIQTVNYGCPGETTASFISGPCPYEAEGFALHNGFSASQETAALSFLRDHPGQVSPITIDLGANDLLACTDASCVAAALNQVGTNLNRILGDLHKASPSSEIIVLLYYNPFAVIDPSSNLVVALNSTISSVARAHGARLADAYTPFNLATPQPQTLCALTLFCTPLQDIHASDAGYAVIADQFWAASGYDRLLQED